MCNAPTLDIVNINPEPIIFNLEEMLGILDLRSLGYYKIKQGILQQNLSKYYKFQRADTLFKHFNKFINVTLWCYYATAPGTLEYTRHLLGLVSWVCE